MLTERAGVQWKEDAKTGNVVRSSPRDKDTEIDVCAQCHARRSQIADNYHAGLPFQDFYRPVLLTPDLYYADGQQRGEVYKWGSFLQSRMYQRRGDLQRLPRTARGEAACAGQRGLRELPSGSEIRCNRHIIIIPAAVRVPDVWIVICRRQTIWSSIPGMITACVCRDRT